MPKNSCGHRNNHPCWSLRGVISLLTVTSVVMVGTITLAITLTTSFETLHSIATKNVLLILSNANVQATAFLQEPANAMDTIRNFTQREAWPLPTTNHTVAEKYVDYATALTYPDRITSFLICFLDGTRIVTGYDILESGDSIYGTQIVYPTPNSTNSNFTTKARLYFGANSTKADASTTEAYSQALLAGPYPYTPRITHVTWVTFLQTTANATSTRYLGFEAHASIVKTECTLMVTFIAPLITPGVQGAYAFAAIGLSVTSVAHMLINAASISGATVIAYTGGGLLIATSERDFDANYQFWQAAAHDPVPLNCLTDVRSLGNTASNGTWFECLRTVTDFPCGGVAAAFNDGFGFSSTPTVISKTVSGVTYVMASGPVRISYPGATVYILVSLEESSVTGDVVTGRDIAIGITCVAVVTVAMSSFVLVTVLLRPLTTVANRMEHAARLDDVDPMPASGMSEIRALQCSFDAMSTELSRIRSFVPHSVMAQNTDVTKEPTAATQPTCANSVYDPTDCELSFTETPRSSSQRTRVQVVTDTYVASRHLNIALGLTSASVTVLVANCEGFLPQVLRASHDEATRGIANLVSVLVDVVKGQGGVLSFFHGDHFVATFNGAKPCASASRRAITAAALIGEPATFAAGSGDIACVLTVGVATGKCLVGNVGCVGAMNFSTIGAPFTQATALQRLNRQYRTRLLTTHRVMRNVDAWFHVRALDVIALPDEDGNTTPTMIGTVLARKTPVVQDVNDPSMYLVTETAECDDVELRRQEVFACIVQRQYNDAISCYRALRRHCRSAAAEVEPPVHSMPRGDDFPDQLPSLIDACRRNIKSSETENPSDASQTSTVVTSHLQHPALTRQ